MMPIDYRGLIIIGRDLDDMAEATIEEHPMWDQFSQQNGSCDLNAFLEWLEPMWDVSIGETQLEFGEPVLNEQTSGIVGIYLRHEVSAEAKDITSLLAYVSALFQSSFSLTPKIYFGTIDL